MDLWVENNPSAIPHRLTFTTTLSFSADFTKWSNYADPTDLAIALLQRTHTQ